MRKSENFDLNLYEGTDIFNPLTTDVPNYEKIDAQMEKNYNLSVGKATELKTGTVHALTRENADCPMIHFTATSNFTSNDTFTVDGVQVSALLVDGSTLPTNCYIIGSEVICYLKGTLLTFFLSGSVSRDSEKLGGKLPDYYAKQVNVDQLETTVNSMGEIVEKNSNDIIKINNSLDVKLLEFTFNNSFFDVHSQKIVKNVNVFSIYLYGSYVKNLKANKAYFIPIGASGYNLQGIGITKTTSREIVDSDAFICNIYVQGNTMVFVPLVDIPSNYNASCICNCINITV